MSFSTFYSVEYQDLTEKIVGNPCQTVSEFKVNVAKRFNIPGKFDLLHGQKILFDRSYLHEYDIRPAIDRIRVRRNPSRLPPIDQRSKSPRSLPSNAKESSTPQLLNAQRSNNDRTSVTPVSLERFNTIEQSPPQKSHRPRSAQKRNFQTASHHDYADDFLSDASSESSSPSPSPPPTMEEKDVDIEILSLNHHYVIPLPANTTMKSLKTILWQKIDPTTEKCRQETHVLLLFTHRMHIFVHDDSDDKLVKDFLSLIPSKPHFYFYTLKRHDNQNTEMYTYETNVSNLFAANQHWWSPVNFHDFHPNPRSESMLLSSLYALRLFFTRYKPELAMWQQAMEGQFFIQLRRFLFPPAVLAMKHAVEGSLFWFEKHLIVDSLIKLLSSLCPVDVDKSQLFDCIPLLFCWLLEECNPNSCCIDHFDHVNLVALSDVNQPYFLDPATSLPLSDGPLILKEAQNISTPFVRHLDLRSLIRHLRNPDHYAGIQKCKTKEYCIYNPPSDIPTKKMEAVVRLTTDQAKQIYKIMSRKYPSFMLITREALGLNVEDRLILLQDLSIGLVFKWRQNKKTSSSSKGQVQHYFELFHPHRHEVGRKKLAVSEEFLSIENKDIQKTLLKDNLASNISVGHVDDSQFAQNDMSTQQITVILLDISRSMIEHFASTHSSDKRTIFDMSIIMLGRLSDNIISGSYPHAFGLFHFGTSIHSDICPITCDRNRFEQGLMIQPEHQEWTCMLDAINEAISAITRYERDSRNKIPDGCRKLIICISDGIDNRSKVTLPDLKKRCADYQIVIDFISFLKFDEIREKNATSVKQFEDFCTSTSGYVYQNLPTADIELGAMFEQEAAVWISERDPKSRGRIEKPKRKLPNQLNETAIHHTPTRTSRAMQASKNYTRVMLEIHDVQQNASDHVIVFFCQYDIFFWKVILKGPIGTPYHTGHWLLFVQFDSQYPHQPPIVRFLTPIYHVNVNTDGKICHHLFDRGWSNQTSMNEVFDAIIDLLKEPNFDDAVSAEKAQLKRDSPDQYHQQAIEHTRIHASKSVEQLKRDFLLDE